MIENPWFHLGVGLTLAGAVTAVTAVCVNPQSRLFGPVYDRGSVTGNQYALTFDDGPTIGATDRVLDTLGELNARAAFFVIGRNVQKHPDLIARMHREGHLIANHSFDHSHYGMLRGPWYWGRQLRDTDAAIMAIIGRRPAMFRPPMGYKTPDTMRAARNNEQAVITWTRRAIDGITTTPQRVLKRLLPHTLAGDVLLLHDGVEPNSRRDPKGTVAAVGPLILGLRDRGLTPAPLDAFLGLPAYDTPARGSRKSAT